MYFLRHMKLPKKENILLLGARGCGKSLYLRNNFKKEMVLWIDLLKAEEEDRYSKNPDLLFEEVAGLPPEKKYVVIDEIQKVPKLLDIVHSLIENSSKIFILTGSSARKLKTSSANLLAGRALYYRMFPLTSFELAESFDLSRALKFGTLPKVWANRSDKIRRKFLETYALTYLNEEIRAEQVVKNLDPFRKFLEVAAQSNGKILNFSKIAKDVGADEKTVRNYFQILEDTLIGFFLEPFNTSLRKKISKSPKFFFFDTGVVRALAKQLTVDIQPGTYLWGDAFEHFVVLEMHRLSQYSGNQFSFSYFRTYDDLEIDVVVDRPGKDRLFIEIKSTEKVGDEHIKHLKLLSKDQQKGEFICLSRDKKNRHKDGIELLFWLDGLRKYFRGPDLKL